MQNYLNLSLDDMSNEEWRDINGYEGLYQVSNMGRVKSLNYNRTKKARIMKQNDNEEYLKIVLYKNGKDTHFRVHKLVALAFIPNTENKTEIDHINTDKYDNRAVNLRWFTRDQQFNENEITRERIKNMDRSNQIKAVKESEKWIKAVKEANSKKVLCITTGKIFNSCVEATEYYNISNKQAVRNSANPNSKNKTAGYIIQNGKKVKLEWKYID